jgi:hypothetical protein
MREYSRTSNYQRKEFVKNLYFSGPICRDSNLLGIVSKNLHLATMTHPYVDANGLLAPIQEGLPG